MWTETVGRAAVSRHRRSRLSAQRKILVSLVAYQIRKAHAGSVLGVAWMVLEPLLYLVTYFFLLTVFRAHSSDMRAEVIMSGLVPWLFFARCVNSAIASLAANAQFFNQINFPVGILPFVSVGVPLVEFGIGLVLLLLIAAGFGTIGFATLLILPASLLLTVFLVAVASIVAPFAVLFPDMRSLVPPLLRLALFFSPVLYLPSLIPNGLSFLPYLNPMAYFISVFRAAVMERSDVYVIGLQQDAAVAAAITAIAVAIAYANRDFVRRTVADYI
jgi:ABC-type polysaccharide/polyol phosphate export permease